MIFTFCAISYLFECELSPCKDVVDLNGEKGVSLNGKRTRLFILA